MEIEEQEEKEEKEKEEEKAKNNEENSMNETKEKEKMEEKTENNEANAINGTKEKSTKKKREKQKRKERKKQLKELEDKLKEIKSNFNKKEKNNDNEPNNKNEIKGENEEKKSENETGNIINEAKTEKKQEETKTESKIIEEHTKILLHIKPISKYLIKYLKNKNIEEFLGDHSKRGLVGLTNLGNTCYMNSAIQCLSNCELLTKYFLSTYYKKEINCSSKYSSGGKIAHSYSEILDKLWKNNKSYINPIDFYRTFTSIVKVFSDSSQHDSHEMLVYLLEKLHEDLNRNVEKKYTELSEKQENETDIEASNRWWEIYLKRDNSIIMDLFLGQYKSTLKCPYCDRISITFDQFSCLELPLENKCFSGTSYVINENDNRIRKINLIFGNNETFKEICEKINCQKTYKAILCRNSKMYLACLKDEHNLYQLIESGQNRKSEPHNKIIFYEYNKNELDGKLLFFVVPVVFLRSFDEASFGIQEDEQYLFFPKIFAYSPNEKIHKFYQDLKSYYHKYFKEKDSNFSDEKIKLRIVNNLTACTKTSDPCDYCGSKECISCEFKFGKEMTMGELKKTQSKSRSFVMYLDIPLENFENGNINSIKLFDDYLNDEEDFILGNELTLENCLNSFSRCEKLDESNEWYCSKCKEHRRGYKQLEIFRLPIYLILHLKRFKNEYGFFMNSKNSTFVKFPIDGLNMNKYIVGPKNMDYIYDLIGVSQHYGLSFIGHYTSACKNNDNWYKFDDDDVSEIDKQNIINSNAYILIYKLRC